MPQIIPVTGFSRDFTSTVNYVSGGSSDLGGTSSVMFKNNVACTKVRVLYANYYNTGNGEITTGISPITVQSAIQPTYDSGVPIQFTFGGINSVVLNPGQQVYSDWLTIPSGGMPVGRYFIIRTFAQVPSGGTLVTGQFTQANSSINGYTGTSGDNYVQHNNTVPANANGSNQLLTSGATSAWYSSTQNYYTYGPLSLDGYATDGLPRPIVALIGDSIMAGIGEQVDQTCGSYIRGMQTLGVPYYSVSRGLEQTRYVAPGALFGQRFWSRASKATVAIVEYGTNDIALSNQSFAQLKANTLIFWQLLAQNGAQIIPTTLLPRPNYTTATFPVSNQTPSTYLSIFQQYNAWIRAPYSGGAGVSATYDAAQLGVTIPTICDAASYVETNSSNATPGGPAAPYTTGYWYCGAGNNVAWTADCVHPNTTGTLAIVPGVTALQNAILATTPSTGTTKSTRFFRSL